MSRSRVREFKLPLTLVFGGSAALALGLCLLLAVLDMEVGLNLSLVGLLLGVLLPLGVEIRNRAGRTRRVLFLDYRSHHYGHAVARGVRATLGDDKRRWTVDVRSPGSASADGAIQWQIKEIQSAVIDEYDALAIVPAGDDENLWFALAAAIKAGTFVVAVDTKPPNRVYRDVGIEPPGSCPLATARQES